MNPVIASMISVVTVCVLTSPTKGAVLLGPVVNPTNGHRYYLLDKNTWDNSEMEAITLGGHLVTINDAAEDDFVFSTFSAAAVAVARAAKDSDEVSLWIGLNDRAIEGNYEWINGEPVTYRNWASDQPEGFPDDPIEDVAAIFVNFRDIGRWHDLTSPAFGSDTYAVVESIPEPSTLILVAMGMVGVLSLRSRKWFC